jgi:hypothetical protein
MASVEMARDEFDQALRALRNGDSSRKNLETIAALFETYQMLAAWTGKYSVDEAKARAAGAQELLQNLLGE